MQKKELSLNKTVFFNILSIILIQGTAFFTTPIFSRLLGTNNYGIFSTFTAWSNILVVIFPLSVGSTLAIALNEYSKEERPAYQSSTLSVGIISTLIFSGIMMLFSGFFTRVMGMSRMMLLCLLIYVLFTYIVNYANTRYTFELQANKNFALAVTSALLAIAISLVLVFSFPAETNYWGRILGGLIPAGVLAAVMLVIIYKDGNIFLKKEYVRFCLPLAIPVIFHSLSNIILNQSDRIMIQGMTTNSLAGIYSLAYNFTMILTSLYSAMNNSWVPFYYRYLGEEGRVNLHSHAKNYINLYTLLAVGFLLVFKEIYSVFADRTYWDGMAVIPVLVIGLYFMFLYSFAVNYEFYKKQTKFMAVITMSAAALNLVLNYVLIKNYLIMGAAVATLVSYLYEFIAHYIFVKKMSKGDYPFTLRFYLKPLIVLGIGIAIYYLCKDLFVVRWVLAVLVGGYILRSVYKRKSIF